MLRKFLKVRPIGYTPNLTSTSSGVLNVIKRFNSDQDYKSDLCSSTILIQDGLSVTELPLIVRKAKNIFEPFENNFHTDSELAKINANTDVHKLIDKELSKCSSLKDVHDVLDNVQIASPIVAMCALKRIFIIKKQVEAGLLPPENYKPDDEAEFEIALKALVLIVTRSQNVFPIMNCVDIISPHSEYYENILCEIILERIAEKKLSVQQICDAVKLFAVGMNTKRTEHKEKLWVGFTDVEKDIGKEDLVKCFSVLHYLDNSQRVVLGVLERRMGTLWWQMQPDDIIQIFKCLRECRIVSGATLSYIARWTNLNIHSLSEENLLQLITMFSEQAFTDPQLERALERYMKAKGIKVKTHILVANILNHCLLFRIRNSHILNGCAEYFVANGKDLPPMYVKPFLYPMGYLNFNPIGVSMFWEKVEVIFSEKFHKINIEDILDVMLSCMFLEKHPLNFISRVFNPQFLERINSCENSSKLRIKLKLLDTALTLECKAYRGPLLPKDHSHKSLWQDGRVRSLFNQIKEQFDIIAGGEECYSSQVILPNLFTTELYVVDVMLHPKGLRSSILNFRLKIDRNINTALLIHLPEHYCGENLIGPQVMRIKHMRLLGLKVVSLKYETLSKLRMHSKELQQYLVDRIKNAESALNI